MHSAADLHQRAVAEVNCGRFGSARTLLGRALARAEGDELVGSIESTLAYVEAETGNRGEAMRLCERALARPGLTTTTRGSVHGQHATLVMLTGRAAEAMEELDRAIGMLEGAPGFLGRALLSRGNLHLQRNDVLRAEADFRAAVRWLTEAGLAVETAMSEHNLGYTRLLAGDLVGALQDMDRARVVLAPLSAVSAATSDQDRAEVLMAAGLVSEGRDALARTARAYGSRRLRRRQAEAELALARSLLQDDPSHALTAARRAARRFQQDEAVAMRGRAEAVALAAEVELGRATPRLHREAERLAAELDGHGLRWAATAVRLQAARVLLRRGSLDEAARLLGGLRVGRRAPLDVRLLAGDVRAELAEEQGRRGVALAHLRRGLAELHAWQSSFGSLDLQTNVVGHGIQLGVRGLTLAARSGSAEVLFEWSERARMLASRVQPVRAPQSGETVADLAELRELGRAGEAARPADAQREAELRRRVREQAWQHRGSGEVTDPVPLEELRAGLGADTALVAYVVTGDRVTALVVTEAVAAVHDLGARNALDRLLAGIMPDLDVAASTLPDPLGGFVRQELATRLGRLGRLLVTPVLDAVGDRRVVLTPSGLLAGVPWNLLPGLTGRPVTVAQSATTWLGRHATPLRIATAGFVAGPRVARAEDEVTAAAKEWDGARVLVGADATADAVAELAAGVDVLHVAAHGRHSAENPLFSGLGLADGPWFGYDIDQLRTVPDVVVLSACEVGRSTVRWGEELIGMTTAWLHAGARCVIASAAAVSDQAAYAALTLVHERLAQGVEPAEALAGAIPAVGPDAPPVPFVCFG